MIKQCPIRINSAQTSSYSRAAIKGWRHSATCFQQQLLNSKMENKIEIGMIIRPHKFMCPDGRGHFWTGRSALKKFSTEIRRNQPSSLPTHSSVKVPNAIVHSFSARGLVLMRSESLKK
jgi:hypothetical protein